MRLFLSTKFVTFLKNNYWPILIFLASRLVVLGAFLFTDAYSIGHGSLTQWDGKVYLDIAQRGYTFIGDISDPLNYVGANSHIAMFPLFPMLIRLFSETFRLSLLNSALFINLIFGVVSSVLLWHIVKRQYSEQVARSSVMLFSFFPYSVFLSMPYTESLAFLLLFAVLYSLSLDKYILSAVTLSLLLVTRIPGFIILPIVLIFWLKKGLPIVKILLLLFLSLIPFLFYLLFQHQAYGTPLAFMIAQNINWHHEATWPWIGFKNFWDYVVSSSSIMWRVDFAWLCIMTATILLSLRKVPWHIVAFSIGVIILALSQTYILGMGRYLMTVITFYIFWGKFLEDKPNVLYVISVAVMSAWLFLNSQLIYLSKMIF